MSEIRISIVRALIVYIGIAIGFSSESVASSSDSVINERLIASLFPGSSLNTFSSVLGRHSRTNVVSNISLKGMKGFVPVEETISLKISESLSVIAFSIYLHKAGLPQDELIGLHPDSDPSNIKLVQIIFYNHENGKVYGKPPGFPLASSGWSCGGDLCNSIEIIDFEPINNSSTAVVFKYSEGLSTHKLRVLRLDGNDIKSSKIYNFGDIGGDSGIMATAEYSDWNQTGNSIFAIVKTACEHNEREFCKALGLPPGVSSERMLMLRL